MPYDSIVTRDDAAGILAPEEISQQIISSLPQTSAALTLFRQVQMSTATYRMPVLSALPFAYWVGGDTGLKQTSDAAWGTKQLVAEEIAVIVPVPISVRDDSSYDILASVQPSLVEAFGVKIDQAVLFGIDKPASWTAPSLVQGATAAGNEVIAGTGTDLASDISDMMATVEEDGYDVNGFVARRRIRAALRDLRDANNALLYAPNLTATTPATLYGEPIAYVSNGAWDDAAAELIAGDFTQAILGIRQDIRFEVFTEGVISDNTGNIVLNLMQQDAIALRATMRVAYQVANPVSRTNTNEATRFPFGVLRPTGYVPAP